MLSYSINAYISFSLHCNDLSVSFTDYLGGVQSVGVPKSRHSGRLHGHGVVGIKSEVPSRKDLEDAHLVVLKHMSKLQDYVIEHMNILRSTHPG
jgi:hypothetical protein